jgi:hypothetical protein
MVTQAPELTGPGDQATAASPSCDTSAGDHSTARLAVTIALITTIAGLVMSVGADARWLAALGRIIAHDGSIPTGIPFASAPTAHWHNTLVLAELIFHGLGATLGHSGLLLAQFLAVALAFTILARDSLAGGAQATGTASALLIVAVGSLASLAVARVQLFSLVLFPLTVLLLRAETRHPSNRIWLVLPLLALWSNLHGGVLSGLVLLYAYLALERFRHDRWTALGVAVAAPIALCLTPAGIDTISYFHGLVTNVAAERGVGLWAPIGGSALDVLLVGAAAILAFRARRSRPRLWELVMIGVLVVLTIKAARDGVWLLFFLCAPASHTTTKRAWSGLLPIGAAVAVVLLVADVAHWSKVGGPVADASQRAIAFAHGSPILGDGIFAEQVALDHGRIWAGNPLDAFSRRVQGEYLDWLTGHRAGRTVLDNPRIRVVIAAPGSDAQRLTAADPSFARAPSTTAADIYVRR